MSLSTRPPDFLLMIDGYSWWGSVPTRAFLSLFPKHDHISKGCLLPDFPSETFQQVFLEDFRNLNEFIRLIEMRIAFSFVPQWPLLAVAKLLEEASKSSWNLERDSPTGQQEAMVETTCLWKAKHCRNTWWNSLKCLDEYFFYFNCSSVTITVSKIMCFWWGCVLVQMPDFYILSEMPYGGCKGFMQPLSALFTCSSLE